MWRSIHFLAEPFRVLPLAACTCLIYRKVNIFIIISGSNYISLVLNLLFVDINPCVRHIVLLVQTCATSLCVLLMQHREMLGQSDRIDHLEWLQRGTYHHWVPLIMLSTWYLACLRQCNFEDFSQPCIEAFMISEGFHTRDLTLWLLLERLKESLGLALDVFLKIEDLQIVN